MSNLGEMTAAEILTAMKHAGGNVFVYDSRREDWHRIEDRRALKLLLQAMAPHDRPFHAVAWDESGLWIG